MPFVARSTEGTIAPPQAKPGVEYDCPACDGTLTVRRGHERDGHAVARHFWHPNGSDCGGESDEHRRMKSIAYWKAEQRWPDATVSFEKDVEIMGWATDDGVHVKRPAERVVRRRRRADVLVEFDDETGYGEGLAIECQYRNEGKDRYGANQDYHDAGLSVLWLEPEQFSGMDVDLDAGDWRTYWTTHVPPPEQWSGYHDVIHWLRQTNYASVEMEVPEFPELVYEEIFRAWEGWYYTDPAYHPVNRIPPLEFLKSVGRKDRLEVAYEVGEGIQ